MELGISLYRYIYMDMGGAWVGVCKIN